MRASVLLLLALVASGAALPLVIEPGRHDFGKAVVNGMSIRTFRVSLPDSVAPGGTIGATLAGPNAADFEVPTAVGTDNAVNCAGWRTGSCNYVVHFRPTSIGVKTATLVVRDSRGNRGTAALRGEGVEVIECRPYLVHCNYAHAYTGTISHTSTDSTIIGAPLGQSGRWKNSFEITVVKGNARCEGTVYELVETWQGNRVTSRTTTQGTISGPALFAVEFQRSSGKLEYRMSFACPTPRLTTLFEDLREGTTETTVTEAEPAEWRDAELAADPQPASSVLMDVLTGQQSDLRPNLGDDVGGVARISWKLLRL